MTPELWTAYEAAAATGGMLCARGAIGQGTVLPEESWVAKGLSIDTRTIKPGEIFVALRDQRDGHDFVRNAFSAGASAALVSRAPEDTPDGAPLLLVNDTLNGLEALAAAARDRCFGKLIAVTGSAGKTSTKEMLKAALAPQGSVHAAERSFNNHLGVPLTLASLPSGTDYGIFEIGMNHAGEITPLSRLVRPHIAIITTVAEAHLEFFDNVEGIARAKAEIFAGLRPAGMAVLPRDNDHFDLLRSELGDKRKFITFGRHDDADYRLVRYQAVDAGAVVDIEIAGQPLSLTLGIAGEHQAMNALAVLAAVDLAGADRTAALEGLAAMHPVEGRGLAQTLTINGATITLIDESYNANPASMAAAILTLAGKTHATRKIAVLGEMRELGPAAAALHLELADKLVAAGIDRVHTAGELMRPVMALLPEPVRGHWAVEASELADQIIAECQPGDVIMAKGSNASRVSAFVTKLQEQADA